MAEGNRADSWAIPRPQVEANTLERVGCGGALMRRGALVLSLLMAGCLRFGPAAGMSSTGIKDLRSCNTETQACALIPDFVATKFSTNKCMKERGWQPRSRERPITEQGGKADTVRADGTDQRPLEASHF